MSQDVMSRVRAIEYGKETSVHKVDLLDRLESLGVLACLAGIGILAWGSIKHGAGSGNYIGLAVCVVGLIVCVLLMVRLRRKSVTLHENGIRVRENGEVIFETLWKDVDYLLEERDGPTEDNFYGVIVHKRDGTNCRLWTLSNFQAMKDTVVGNVYRVKTADTLQQLSRGGTVEFKGLVIKKDGVVSGGQLVPWHVLRGRLENFGLTIYVRKTGQKIWFQPTGAIPNFLVLLEVLRQAGIEPE